MLESKSEKGRVSALPFSFPKTTQETNSTHFISQSEKQNEL